MLLRFFLSVSLISLLFCGRAFASIPIYTNLGPGDPNAYGGRVVELALQKTESEYGEYLVKNAPAMNEARALYSIKRKIYDHPIRVFHARKSTFDDQDLRVVPFPIFLGVYSYRICWVNNNTASSFSDAKSLGELKTYVHGQLRDWYDGEILRANGFSVKTGSHLQGLYFMLEKGRIDVLCRGASEPFEEWHVHDGLKNISLDKALALYYPLPHFLFTAKDDHKTAERLLKGLQIAYEDGSLIEMWKQNYERNMQRSKLRDRIILELENPELNGVDTSYLKYIYQPYLNQQLVQD